MLSKMKVASLGTVSSVGERARSPASGRASNTSEDMEDNNSQDNDSNNNNSININNNNNDITIKSLNNNPENNDSNNNDDDTTANELIVQVSQGKKQTEEQLLEIVEVARRRRLSKDSADSLTSFIRWSFSHLPIDPAMQRLQDSLCGLGQAEKLAVLQAAAAAATAAANGNLERVVLDADEPHMLIDDAEETINEVEDDDDDDLDQHDIIDEIDQTRRQQQHSKHDDEDDCWQPAANQQANQYGGLNHRIEQLRQHAKLSSNSPFGAGAGSSAANLALMRSCDLHKALNLRNDYKRARTHLYSPDSKPFSATFHQDQQQRHHQQQMARKNSVAGGYLGNVVERLHQQQHLQQLQQQQRQQQQVEQQQQQAASINNNNNNGNNGNELSFHLQQFLQQQTTLEDLCSSVGIEENNQLVLAAAIHRALVDSVGGSGGSGAAPTGGASANTASSQLSQALNHLNHNNNNNHQDKQQQQQHNNHQTTHNNNSHQLAGAESLANVANRQRRTYNTRAAMLSAASNSQSSSAAAVLANRQSGQQQQQLALNSSNRAQQQRHAQAAAALSALASGDTRTSANQQHQHQNQQHQQHQQHQQQSALSSSTPMVDFECDTCGSSFDDRHRLMQHQSIHLELKKDWFTETPVDEVMKIFNRRRGEFLCNTCNLRFEATFDYDKHNHLEHGPRPYCCQFCGNGTRTFRFWRQYLNHLYDHRYIFSCTIDDCDFTVNRRDSLRFHIFRFHLNCQLPQNSGTGQVSASAAAVAAAALQHQQLRGISTRAMLGLESSHSNNKWDDDVDLLDANGNEMNVVE